MIYAIFTHSARTSRARASYPWFLLALLIVTAPATSLFAQTAEDALLFSQRLPATGARSVGLSGTGFSGIGDYSAFYTNPAGLAWMRSSQIGGSLSFLSAADKSQPSQNGFGETEENLTEQRLGNFAGVFKVPTKQGSLVVGAAFNQTNSFNRNMRFSGLNNQASITDVLLPFPDEFEVVDDNGSFYPSFFSDIPEIAYLGGAIEFLGENVGTGNDLFYQAVNPGSTIEQTSDVFQTGSVKELSLGGAVEAARGVMVGASLNFSFGSYEFESFFDEFDINGENTEDLYVVLDGDRVLSGFDLVTYEERFNSDLIGTNFRVGVSADALPELRVGLTIESPTFYRVDESYATVISTEFDSGGFLSYGGQSGDIGRGSFEYDITTPWRFGAGLAYTVSDLTLMGDVELVDWTQLQLDASVDRDYFNELNRTIRSNFKAIMNTRLGAEYRLNNVSLRGGFAYRPDPIDTPQERGDGSTLDRDRMFFSAGAGFQISNAMEINFGWMQERQKDIYYPDFVDYVVDEDVVRNHIMVGLNVLF